MGNLLGQYLSVQGKFTAICRKKKKAEILTKILILLWMLLKYKNVMFSAWFEPGDRTIWSLITTSLADS